MMHLCGEKRVISDMFRNELTRNFCLLLAAPVIDCNISEMSESCQMASGVLSLIKNKSEPERKAAPAIQKGRAIFGTGDKWRKIWRWTFTSAGNVRSTLLLCQDLEENFFLFFFPGPKVFHVGKHWTKAVRQPHPPRTLNPRHRHASSNLPSEQEKGSRCSAKINRHSISTRMAPFNWIKNMQINPGFDSICLLGKSSWWTNDNDARWRPNTGPSREKNGAVARNIKL